MNATYAFLIFCPPLIFAKLEIVLAFAAFQLFLEYQKGKQENQWESGWI